MNGVEDPGWRPALVAIIPLYGFRTVRRKGSDGLTALRSIVVALVSALLLFVVVIADVVEMDDDPTLAPLVVIGLGIVSLMALGLLARRSLSTGSIVELANSWRTRMFTGVGLAELPGLVGIAAAIISDTMWVYLIGMTFSLAGFWQIAPSRRNLARDQDSIRSVGSSLDLTQALMQAGPGGSRPAPGVSS